MSPLKIFWSSIPFSSQLILQLSILTLHLTKSSLLMHFVGVHQLPLHSLLRLSLLNLLWYTFFLVEVCFAPQNWINTFRKSLVLYLLMALSHNWLPLRLLYHLSLILSKLSLLLLLVLLIKKHPVLRWNTQLIKFNFTTPASHLRKRRLKRKQLCMLLKMWLRGCHHLIIIESPCVYIRSNGLLPRRLRSRWGHLSTLLSLL